MLILRKNSVIMESKRSRDKFSWDNILDQYEDLYEELNDITSENI